jgi:anti-sigma factor RsiW
LCVLNRALFEKQATIKLTKNRTAIPAVGVISEMIGVGVAVDVVGVGVLVEDGEAVAGAVGFDVGCDVDVGVGVGVKVEPIA